jgi:hypothetical protein
MVNLGNKRHFGTPMGKLENKNESDHQDTVWVQTDQNCSEQ